MDAPPKLVMTVTLDPMTGQVDFLIPHAGILALGMYRMLGEQLKRQVIKPAFEPRILRPKMPHEE
jgi:hypothetical protein